MRMHHKWQVTGYANKPHQLFRVLDGGHQSPNQLALSRQIDSPSIDISVESDRYESMRTHFPLFPPIMQGEMQNKELRAAWSSDCYAV